jgi:hypothetical protein
MDLNGFNALEIEPATSYEPLPADWYKAVITRLRKSQRSHRLVHTSSL